MDLYGKIYKISTESSIAAVRTTETFLIRNGNSIEDYDHSISYVKDYTSLPLEDSTLLTTNSSQGRDYFNFIHGDIALSNFSINSTQTNDNMSNTIGIFNYNEKFSFYGLGLIAIFCTFIVITIIGNTLVILAVVTTRRLRTVTNCFVMSLAVADLLVGIFVMPLAVAVHITGAWQLGWILCDIWISLDVLLCTASILSLCAISVDRYLAVTQPLTYSRKRRSKRLALTMILIVWSLALAITCPPMLGWYEPGRRDLTECRYNQNEGYVIFSAMGSFFIPMAVMIYVYARISCVIATRHDNMTDINVHNKKNRKFHTVEADRELDQDTSEPEVCPNQKKQLAARTLSNQTIVCTAANIPTAASSKDRNINENDENGGFLKEPKSGSYELINLSSRPSSFKRSPNQLSTTTPNTATIISSPSPRNPDQWSHTQQPQRSHSVRHHHTNTTYVSSGCDTYITRNTRAGNKSLSNRITSLKKENKTTQTLSIVVGGFIACWLPFFIHYISTPFLSKEHQNHALAEFLTWLGWFNSACNPFIYAFYSVDFRAAFWRLTFRRFFHNSSKGQFPSNTMSIRR